MLFFSGNLARTVQRKCRIVGVFGVLMVLSNVTMSSTLDQQRKAFVRAEQDLAQGQYAHFQSLTHSLIEYPLYPFLMYQWLVKNLEQTPLVVEFLQTYPSSRYAKLLTEKWLIYLAEHKQWTLFLTHYHATDNAVLQCYVAWAHYLVDDKLWALNEAKRLWLSGVEQPNACEPLFVELSTTSLFSTDLVWQRFHHALLTGNYRLAHYLRNDFTGEDLRAVDLWLRVNDNPMLITEVTPFVKDSLINQRIVAYGLKKAVKKNMEFAVSTWTYVKPQLQLLSIQELHVVERALAMALAVQHDPRAYTQLQQLSEIDDEVREWKVRVALYEQNWSHVREALAALSVAQQALPIWQYWLGRSLAVQGDLSAAKHAWNNAAQDRSFYGFLAADAIAAPYAIKNQPLNFLPAQLKALSERMDFTIIHELLRLKRKNEAQSYWWFAVEKLSKEEKLQAAKLAQLWDLDQLAILTLVKAEYWDDLGVRFPIRHYADIMNNAERNKLAPEWLYGVIRQESMFDPRVQSIAGAQGLMQLMPSTGAELAQELKLNALTARQLLKPKVNIQLGSYYIKKLLKRFNSHFVLAIAAYNAGPARVKSWLPNHQSMPADIWLETLPYKETRKYITSVFSYAIIYNDSLKLFNEKNETTLKLNTYLTDIR